jgi:DNA-binding NarL/FixJ family response regulator
LDVIIYTANSFIRAGVRAIIDELPDISVLADADSHDEALSLASQYGADVILLDEAIACQPDKLGALSGIDSGRDRALVALVGELDHGGLQHMLRHGVRAIVCSDEPPQHLAAGLRAAAAGGIYISPNLTGSLIDMLSATRPDDPRLRLRIAGRLTPRETEVLTHVVRGRPNQEIATRLSVTEKTIKFHVSSILTKLAVRSRAELIALVANITDRPISLPDGEY